MISAVRFAFACLAAAAVIAFGGHPEAPQAERGGWAPARDSPPDAARRSPAEARDSTAERRAGDSDDQRADYGETDGRDTDDGVADDADDDPAGDDVVATAPLSREGMIAIAEEESRLADGPDGGKRHKRPRGGCPSNMVRVRDYCMDRYEAPNRRGAKPLAMQSANDAVAWCSEHHKRICTEDEWIAACEGEEHRTYPYGAEHVDGRCNDDKPWRKVDEATLAKWPSPEAREHARDLYQALPSGWKRRCASDTGVRDLTGNVEEWVARTREHANDYPYILIGCYWSGCYGGNKPTCHSTNNAHGPEFRFYETGFRCCRDAAKL